MTEQVHKHDKRYAPIPPSMKTTPRLFERVPLGPGRRRFHRKGGDAPPNQACVNTVIVQSPRVPALEWADLRGSHLEEIEV